MTANNENTPINGKISKKPEVLAPAGSLDVLKTAVMYGADAVYIGGDAYGLRAKAKNFSLQDMKEGIEFAHEHGAKVYVTANIIARNGHLDGIREYFKELKVIKPDALLIADPGVFMIAREICPEIDIHISTQANNVNYATYNFWFSQGATRVVAARELSLKEIADIRKNIPADKEIEAFVHGAMCIAYSGRCLLSSYFTGRSANLGACTHPCRWKYYIMEEKRPGEYLPVEEVNNGGDESNADDLNGTYIFNSKDLCMIEHLPDMINAGIDSLKIEGRMKTALYVASVVRTYRMAVDDYFKDPALYESRKKNYMDEISRCTYRQYTTGFFYHNPTHESQIYDNNTYVTNYVYLGTIDRVDENGYAWFTQKNKFMNGDTIELMKPDGSDLSLKVIDMINEEYQHVDSCPHASERIAIRLDASVSPYDIMRVRQS
ncbi:MAG: U32 family peptidase [Lachnospiraceae bacterium]|nr:U32 family peptidase [Lachnospiraceae bacterium]MEE3460990.1 U32 family peptidase [Lachnospiraceae bacterium]